MKSKNVGTGISIVSGLICVAALWSNFKSSNVAVKNFALNLGLVSGAIGVTAYGVGGLSAGITDDLVNELVGKQERETKRLKMDLSTIQENAQKQRLVVDEKIKTISQLEQERVTLSNFVEQLKAQTATKLVELNSKLAEDSNIEEKLKSAIKVEFEQLCLDRIRLDYDRLGNVIDKKLEDTRFSNIHDQLHKFYDILRNSYGKHFEIVKSISTLEMGVFELNRTVTDIFFGISDQTAALKVRLRNLLNIDERVALNEALEELTERRDPKQFVPADRAREALNRFKSGSDEDIKKLEDSFKLNCADFADLKNQVYDLINEIDRKNLEIADLKEKVHKLNFPKSFYGGSNIPLSGNAIIKYYYERYGYKLDGVVWEETETGYKLIFSIQRNPGLTEQEFYADNSREQLAAFTNALKGTLPEVEFNYQHCLLTLNVQLRKLVKKDTAKSDIDAIWIPAKKFESYVRRWERIRITAGSTGGKSPTAKNLALAIMNSRKGVGEIRLYDPQHGSKKDYWDMVKVGISHEDNLQGMKELCKLIDDRRHGHNHQFVLYIFDEVDNTVSQLKEGAKFRDLIKVSLKEGSHADVGVIYIGQSADANEVPGMTHSNWNNAVQLHIGTNAGTAIEKLTTLTTEDKTKLLNQYRRIQEYCDRMNEELGLDIFTDSGAYRFALAVPLTGLPKFIQLPDFDSYDYSEVMGGGTPTVKPVVENPIVEIKCPHCASAAVKQNGKTAKGEQYYSCQSCDGKPKKWRLTNSN